MKFAIATLLAGGTLLPAAEFPSPGYDECAIVSTEIASADATLIEPDPQATAMRLFVYCGQRVPNSSGSGSRNEPALKWIDVDSEQAEIIAAAAADLLDEDVFKP